MPDQGSKIFQSITSARPLYRQISRLRQRVKCRWRLLGWRIALAYVLIVGVDIAAGQHITVIKTRDIAPYNQALNGFTERCGAPANVYDLQGDAAQQDRAFARIQASEPDLVLAIGPVAAQLAHDRLADIPVVFVMVTNPAKHKLNRPHVVGISLDIPIQQQFRIYRTLIPSLQTIGTLYDPGKSSHLIRQAYHVAKEQGIKIIAIPIVSSREVPSAFRSIRSQIDAFWMLPDDTVVTKNSFKFLLLETIERRLPLLAISSIFVKVGALASLAPNYTQMGHQACELAQKVLLGAWNFDRSRIIAPDQVHLSINLKTADKINLTISKSIIESSSQVFR